MTIKPEDISDDIAVDILLSAQDCAFPPSVVAAILNAAIEAGVVSPPCHVVRDTVGKIVCTTVCGMKTNNIVVIQGKPFRPNHEHWKGQTE
jgi:hypothetical protein